MAQAAENLKWIKGCRNWLLYTNVMRDYVKRGTVAQFGLWDVKQQGALATYVANEIVVKGKKLKVGDSFEVKGIGKVKVEPNSIQGYDYEAEGNGIIVLPERVVFTKDNIDKYNFSRQKRPNISDVFISSLIMNSFFSFNPSVRPVEV